MLSALVTPYASLYHCTLVHWLKFFWFYICFFLSLCSMKTGATFFPLCFWHLAQCLEHGCHLIHDYWMNMYSSALPKCDLLFVCLAGLYCLMVAVSFIQTLYWDGSSGLVRYELWRFGCMRVWSGWEVAGGLVSPAGSLLHRIPRFQCGAKPIITVLSNLLYFSFSNSMSLYRQAETLLLTLHFLSKPQICMAGNFPTGLVVLCTWPKPFQQLPVALTGKMWVANASWH